MKDFDGSPKTHSKLILGFLVELLCLNKSYKNSIIWTVIFLKILLEVMLFAGGKSNISKPLMTGLPVFQSFYAV